jgi:hypothetical protein
MRRPATFLLGVYLTTFDLICLTFLLILWPGARDIFPNVPINPSSDEIRLLLISVMAGALGSGVVLLLSFILYVGNRRLVGSWTWYYVAWPIVGMTTGLFVYIAIRGGILKTGGGVGADVLNPYAVATISVLGGAFSKQILDKLNEFAQRQFQASERVHKDALPPN